ncbi:MAG: hypothetical protein AB8B83_00985 [Bdellovibrionales bacterium]
MTYKQELNPPLTLEGISDQDFLRFGMHDIAYIKRVVDNNNVNYVVHAADGTLISSMNDMSSALAAIITNDLEPITLQ